MAEMHCIINPMSRDGNSGKLWPKILPRLEENWKVTAHMTESVGHATEIAWKLRKEFQDAENKPLIVAMGGDGTVNEVASALRGSGCPNDETTRIPECFTYGFAYTPTGSGY